MEVSGRVKLCPTHERSCCYPLEIPGGGGNLYVMDNLPHQEASCLDPIGAPLPSYSKLSYIGY